MNIEIQKKIKERQNKKQKQSMKGQASTEYPMMMIIALILIALAFVVILAIGGKTAKSGTLHADLLSAKASSAGNTFSIATNLPIKLANSGQLNFSGTPESYNGIVSYNVSGAIEYEFTGISPVINGYTAVPGNVITSLTVTGTSGTKILLLPASGTTITVRNGTAPFTITNLGS